jgi:hypothetical protein
VRAVNGVTGAALIKSTSPNLECFLYRFNNPFFSVKESEAFFQNNNGRVYFKPLKKLGNWGNCNVLYHQNHCYKKTDIDKLNAK